MKVYNNILDLIGNTPLVKYNDNILLKLENFNPSSSIKDRASFYMINDAIKSGLINNDTKVIEPTSGNTGIGLAMCCASLGIKLIIVMPENMSEERKKLISAYGAELVLTEKEKGMQGAVDKAYELGAKYPNSFIPMQFSNQSNPQSHIDTTAKEIFEDTEGKVDIVVAGVGTGGTAIGIKKGLSILKPDVKVFGVEPKESPLLTEGYSSSHKIQGIGANFIPEIYKLGDLDGIIDVKGDDAILEAKLLAKSKGVLAGISSGANLCAAKEISRQYPNKLIVTIVCDSGERYLSTELFD